MPAAGGMRIAMGEVEMRDLVTPSVAAEQVAVKGLLALASLLWAGGSWDQVLSPGTAAKQAAA